MSAPIVYQGQIQGRGGTLFKDSRFWVAHRVPMRTTWIQNIENNGGSIVQLDKQADFLIADHAKKDVPAGSYSWKWIEDSVNAGKLMDKKDYLISAPGNESRPVGSVPHKSTRKAFTKEDDSLLSNFVTKHERRGIAVSGNVIYKHFEAKHPHHTFQSWRDRWVKKLQFLPRPQVSDSSPSPPPEATPTAVMPQPQLASNALPEPPAYLHAASVNASSPRKRTRTRFTEEEDKLLLQYVEELKMHGKGLSGNNVYQGFAEDFPQHTWQAWRDRYLKQLRPREAREDDDETPQPSPARSNIRSERPPKAVQASKATIRPRRYHDDAAIPPLTPRKDPPHAAVKDVQQEDVKPNPPKYDVMQHTHHRGEERGGQDTVFNDPELAATPIPLQQSNFDHRGDTDSSNSSELGNELVSSQVISQGQHPPIGTKEEFYQYFNGFLESETQIDQERLKIWPTIQGRTFELWDLWTVVQSQKVEAAERDWQRVAEDIGYNWVNLPTAPDEIRQCYETHLYEFEEAMMSYADSELDGVEEESKNEDEDEDGEAETPQRPLARFPALHSILSDGQFNSSPPKQPSLKRSHESALSSDLVYPDSSRKRSRLDRDGEIPSTPDEKNGTLHLRPPISAGVTPHDRQRFALSKSTDFLHSNRKGKQLEVNDQKAYDEVRESAAQSESERVALEPETQDYRFETQVMDDVQQETQPEITPSQQLRSEIDAEERRKELNQASPTRKRKAVKSPFLADDEEDEEDEMVAPGPHYDRGAMPLLARPESHGSKRRSLPASFAKRMKASGPVQKSSPGHSHASSQVPLVKHQERSSAPARPPPKPRSKAEELAEVTEYWMSLGYSHDNARRSLEATTWEPGLAGRIMQLLREGQSMPMNWEGVWSARDDESLRLVYSAEPPGDEKEAKKRRKAADRLRDKHGEERMELRKKWLAVKAKL